jgi:mRNA interferase MazF
VASILRGDIWWADLNPGRGHEQKGVRPVFIISHDVFNERSGIVIALALTSQEPKVGFPLAIEITSAELPRKSWVRIGQIRTLATERLSKKISKVSPEESAQVIEGLNEIVG